MDTLEIFPLPAFEDNYIWCLRRDGRLAVVDPGDAGPVLAHLEKSGERLAAVLITHRHRDHTGGIADLTARHPAPVFGPAAESIPGVDHPVAGGDTVALPALNLKFQVLDVAGHTRGHVAYYLAGSLFCGDTLFGCGCGRLFEGTPAQMHAALGRIGALPPLTLIYCAHEYTASGLRFARAVEPDNLAVAERSARVRALLAERRPSVPFTLAEELATNPFLRCRAPAVVAAARARLGREPTDEIEVFAALRSWRDAF
jgi:hydroxyacylglutathione hydrolase